MTDDTTALKVLQLRLQGIVQELLQAPDATIRIQPLVGDASSRRYSRIHIENAKPASLMLVQYPEENRPADELGAPKISSQQAFSEIARLLQERQLPVPQILQTLDAGRSMILQDLGDQTFYQRLQSVPKSEWPQHYEQAIDLMALMHQRCWPLPETHTVRQRAFDAELLRSELEHFREWGLQELFPEQASQLQVTLDALFEKIVAQVSQQVVGFVHRDFQSKNLMWDQQGRLCVIDFQDALTGPRIYDLVALLCDSYVALDAPLQLQLLERYRERMAIRDRNAQELQSDFWWLTLQRKLKDAGRFIYIDRVRKNPRFLGYYPQSLVYVGRALHALGMQQIVTEFSQVIPGFPEKVAVPAAKS